jgi:predicted membrane protein
MKHIVWEAHLAYIVLLFILFPFVSLPQYIIFTVGVLVGQIYAHWVIAGLKKREKREKARITAKRPEPEFAFDKETYHPPNLFVKQ